MFSHNIHVSESLLCLLQNGAVARARPECQVGCPGCTSTAVCSIERIRWTAWCRESLTHMQLVSLRRNRLPRNAASLLYSSGSHNAE